jgi:flagellar biosynthesis/type III secretory pathway chaperone
MLRNIPSATLKELVRLSERKELLMAQIQEIDRQMLRVQKRFGIPPREEDRPAPVTVSRARPRRNKSRR